jgi:hypothetical protein
MEIFFKIMHFFQKSEITPAFLLPKINFFSENSSQNQVAN